MNNLHSKTIAFTGHRFIPFERQPKLKSLLRQSIATYTSKAILPIIVVWLWALTY